MFARTLIPFIFFYYQLRMHKSVDAAVHNACLLVLFDSRLWFPGDFPTELINLPAKVLPEKQ